MKIFALIGRSGTGKSSIEKQLEKLGHTRIVSNTTRPIREHEVDGIDYNFLTDKEFLKLKKKNQLIEHSQYRGWNYGIAKILYMCYRAIWAKTNTK
mgnify:CR=1 FL=1